MKSVVTKVQTDGTTVQRLERFTARVPIYPTAQRLNRKTANLSILYKIIRYLHSFFLFFFSKMLFFQENLQKYTFSVYLLHLYNAVNLHVFHSFYELISPLTNNTQFFPRAYNYGMNYPRSGILSMFPQCEG
ncbi:MAG: hypothetical protein LBT04_03560 [Prevotellaceae bacterium]|nr:hypothetical protein [Prevotellaceae bacterium]